MQVYVIHRRKNNTKKNRRTYAYAYAHAYARAQQFAGVTAEWCTLTRFILLLAWGFGAAGVTDMIIPLY